MESGIYRYNKESNQVEKISDEIKSISNDVYFRGPYFDEHLADGENPRGQWVFSKKHKSEILKKNGWREKGDMVRGMRNFDKVRFKLAKERGEI